MTTGAFLVLSDPIPEAVATLDALFEYAARIAPQQRIGGLDPGQSITFQELVDSGRALVRPLIAHGVTAGMPVIVPAGTASGFLPLLYAIAAAGAVIVPVRAQTTPRKMAAVVEDSGAGLILAEDTVVRLLARVLPDKVGTLALGDVTRESREAGTADGSAPAHRPEDLAVIQYTSGSTSNPRGVALTHRNVLSALRIIHTALKPRQADVIYHWLPLSHDMGLFGTLASLGAGIRVVISSPRDFVKRPDEWLAAGCAAGATILVGPDFFYRTLVEVVPPEAVEHYDLSGVWLALNGAEPIDPVMLERFGRHFAPAGLRPEALVPCYGLAEATLPVSFDSHERPPTVDWVNRAALNDDLLAVPGVPGASETRGVVSCGTTPPGVEVRITADGRVLGERGVGEIEIRGDAVTAGYYRESEPSGLPGGWRGTGDLGYLADGCLYVTGRSKEMLILAGQNYYPQDVEDGVRSVPGVYRRAAIAVVVPPDPAAELPERIAVLAEAVLVDDPDTAAAYTALAAGIRRAAAGALGGATVDVVLLTPNTIMRTTSGKFQRLLMRKRLLKGTLGSVVAHVSARETLPPSAAAGGAPSPR